MAQNTKTTKDEHKLTEGSIAKSLFALTLPLLLGDILQQFYNTVDAVIIGRFVGEAAFAAAGISGTLMNLFIFIISGCCIGMSVLFARFYGEGDLKKFRREFFTALSFGGIFTILISVFGIFFLPLILGLISTPGQAFSYAENYLSIIFAGLIATYLYNMFSALLRSTGNTKPTLYFLFAGVMINLLLDLLFVAVFDMGMQGAALATVLSQLISALLCFAYIRATSPELIFTREDICFDLSLLKATFSYGSLSALQQSGLHIGKVLVQSKVNSLGLSAISAYTAAGRIEGYVNSAGVSGTQAESIFAAQNYGAGKFQRVKKGALTGSLMYIILGLIVTPAMAFFSEPLILLMLPSAGPEILAEGSSYLRYLAPFYIFDYIGCIMSGYFKGIGRIHLSFFLTIGQVTIRVIFSYILADLLGLSGVALATGIGWSFAMIYVSINYIRTKRHLTRSKEFSLRPD